MFLFNEQFQRTNGLTVEKADNVSLISKNTEPVRKFQKVPNKNNEDTDDDLKVGKNFILKKGPLKGYQGKIVSITKDQIEVRVASKGCTEWVDRQTINPS